MRKKVCVLLGVVVLMLTGCNTELSNRAMGMENEPLPEIVAEAAATESVTDEEVSGTIDEESGTESTAGINVRILCVDENGNPVDGAIVQICSGDMCQTRKSNSEGIAEFTGDQGIYTVEGLRAPAGYKLESRDEITVSRSGDVEIGFIRDESDDVEADERVDKSVNGTVTGEYPALEFSTVDYQGNAVDSSILGDARVTMINYWEDWCGWCLKEMPGMEKMFEKYRDEGLQIIGIYTPEDKGYDYPSDYNEVKKILDEYGIQYTIVEYCDAFEVYDAGSRPVSFFVDSEGNLLSAQDDKVCYEYARAVIDSSIERYEAAAGNVKESKENREAYNAYVEEWKSNYERYAEDYMKDLKNETITVGYIPERALEAKLRYFLGLD